MSAAAWTVAVVQMDVTRGDVAGNLARVRDRLADGAGRGARLVVFPECVLSGYGFDSAAEALPFAEPVLGPSTDRLADDCRRLGVWVVLGMLETPLANVAVLIGPDGVKAVYRKAHLPCLGVDRFTTPGKEPFAVHDLGGLRVGMLVCYDSSFPEASRCLMLHGADLIALPTNWPAGARRTAEVIPAARALENHVYFAVANRVGSEAGFTFLGLSQIVNPLGEPLARCDDDRPTTLVAEIDPAFARAKRRVNVPGKYELDRLADRRPELYGELVNPPRPRPDRE